MNNMSRRNFLRQSLATAGMLSMSKPISSYALQGNKKKLTRPNIIFLLTDDQRHDSLGCAGNSIVKTPNIDLLAERGVRFRNHFITTAICMSSRASILTGQYTSRHGIEGGGALSEDSLANIYPVLLRKAGYKVGFIGKFCAGEDCPPDKFDYSDCIGDQEKYFPEFIDRGRHMTSRLGDSALKFLDEYSSDDNFCLSVSFKAPHAQDGDPRQYLYDPKYEELYKNITIPHPKTATESHFNRLPKLLQVSEARTRWKIRFSNEEFYQRSVKSYYRLITGVDEVVGRIMNTLRDKGIADNTVIIFSSDQGVFLGEHGLAGKWFMHEESIRAPLIIYSAGLAENRKGYVSDSMSLNIDIALTILDLAGLKQSNCMQGYSLLPALENNLKNPRKDFLYEHMFDHPFIPKCYGVRNERYKYAYYFNNGVTAEQLFDLDKDQYEETDLAQNAKYANMLQEMRSRCDELKKQAKS